MANSAVMAVEDEFDAEFIFIWKIKNFSHCLPWTWLRSPTFTVESMDNTKWWLHLWPKEYTNGVHMEYYLARDEEDGGPEIVRVAFELSFLDPHGIQLLKKSCETFFIRDTFKGFAEFVEQSKVYTYRRNEYLPGNTLTGCCRMRQIGRKPQKTIFCSATSEIGASFEKIGKTFDYNIVNFSKIRPGMKKTMRIRNPGCCRMRQIGRKPQKTIFCSATSEIGAESSSFEWNIENFSKIRPGMKKTMRIKYPPIKVEFSLTAKPEESFQFEISHSHMDEPNMTDCEISIINASKDAIYSIKDSRHLEGSVWKFPIFLTKKQLTVIKSLCLQNDVLALKLCISISLGVTSSVIDGYRSLASSLEDQGPSLNAECSSNADETISSAKNFILDLEKDVQKLLEEFSSMNENSSTHSEESSLSMDESSFPTQNGKSFASEDEKVSGFHKFDKKSFNMDELAPTGSMKKELHNFYQDGTFSDIILTAGNETFPVHRFILSLKSPKFKEIFMNDLSKRNINLPDLDPETMRDLLDFIYTNKVNNMTCEKAQKLFAAGKNYQVASLKQLCLRFIKENINESNACSVLILADEQKDEEVKQLTLQFIVEHGKAIMNTKAWVGLTTKHIKLAFETMQQMYLNKD